MHIHDLPPTLLEPLLTYWQLNNSGTNFNKHQIRIWTWIYIWKGRLRKGVHSVRASLCRSFYYFVSSHLNMLWRRGPYSVRLDQSNRCLVIDSRSSGVHIPACNYSVTSARYCLWLSFLSFLRQSFATEWYSLISLFPEMQPFQYIHSLWDGQQVLVSVHISHLHTCQFTLDISVSVIDFLEIFRVADRYALRHITETFRKESEQDDSTHTAH